MTEYVEFDKNDIVTSFLENILELYCNKNYDIIYDILLGDNSDNIRNNNNINNNSHQDRCKYIDEDTVVNVRVWTDRETKESLDIIYYVCKYEDVPCINNEIINLWLVGNVIGGNIICDRECDRDKHISFRVENALWNEFRRRCQKLDITIPSGFKMSVDNFILRKAGIII